MPRNDLKITVGERNVDQGTGSKWTGRDGSKYTQADGTDGQRVEQRNAAARLNKKSDGGFTTEPTKELPVTKDKFKR